MICFRSSSLKAKPKFQQEQSHIPVVQQEACVNSRFTLKSVRSSPMSTRMRLRRSLFSLFDSRAADLQNDASLDCGPRLERGDVWEMTKAVCGLVDAPADFDEHFG